ncbi:MAG: lectin like domain-containing protein [Anaerovoracaceae bacterium]
MKGSKIAALIISVGLVSSLMPVAATAAQKTVLDSSEYEELGKLVKSGDNIAYELSDPSILLPKQSAGAKAKAALPEKLDLRDKDNVQPIKNQGKLGTCWAFGALASLESSLIMAGNADKNIDLSERHLVYFANNGKNKDKDKSKYAGGDTRDVGKNDLFQIGGNVLVSVQALARGYGAVDESLAPYSGEALDNSLQTKSHIRLTDAEYLPNPTGNGKAETIIKNYIQNRGIVAISYRQNKKYLNLENSAIYCYEGEGKHANHAVSLVGWDDNYSKDNFGNEKEGIKPPGDGAWIMRNSWGSKAGKDGYYYISYYDQTLIDATSFQAENQAYNKENTDHQYSGTYQYDGVGPGDGKFTTSKKMIGANVFNARKDELIRSISTYTAMADSEVSVAIYENPTSVNPESGNKLFKKTFPVKYAGYHTLDLGKDIGIAKGDKFSVVISIKHPDGSYSVPFEVGAISQQFDVCSQLDYSKGQSYMKNGSYAWSDMSDMVDESGDFAFGNATVKAFTLLAGTQTQSISVKKTLNNTYGDKAFKLNAKLKKGDGRLSYRSADTNIAKISTNGTVTIKAPGKVDLYVQSGPTKEYKASKEQKVLLTVKPKKATLSSAVSSKAGTLKATWKKDTKATGYQVRIGKNSSFTSGKQTYTATKNTTTSKTFTKLSKKKYYYVKVRSYKISGSDKIYGSYSTTKKLKVK